MKQRGDDIPEDPERADQIRELEQIKKDLDKAISSNDVNAVRELLAKLTGIPSDLLAQVGLTQDKLQIYAEKATNIENQRKASGLTANLPARNLTYGEKAAEQALGNIISVNNMLEAYLNSSEVTVSRERNKRWVAQPGSVDVVAFVADREKVKPKRDIVVKAYLETNFDPEVIKLARSKLVSEVGETHEEVRKFDARKAAELNRTIKAGTQFKEDLSDETKLLRESAVEKVMGKEKAAAAVRENEAQIDAINQVQQRLLAQQRELSVEGRAQEARGPEGHASKKPDFDAEAIKEARSQLVSELSSEIHKEVRKFDAGIEEALSKTIEHDNQLKEVIGDEKQPLKDSKLEEVLGKEKADAADKESEALVDASEQEAKRQAARAKRQAKQRAKPKLQEAKASQSYASNIVNTRDAQLSPPPTPSGKQGPSPRGAIRE